MIMLDVSAAWGTLVLSAAVALVTSMSTSVGVAWRAGRRAGQHEVNETMLASDLKEIKASMETVRMDTKALDERFTEYLTHRFEDLDARYQRSGVCNVIHDSMKERFDTLPAVIMGDKGFRDNLRTIVSEAISISLEKERMRS